MADRNVPHSQTWPSDVPQSLADVLAEARPLRWTGGRRLRPRGVMRIMQTAEKTKVDGVEGEGPGRADGGHGQPAEGRAGQLDGGGPDELLDARWPGGAGPPAPAAAPAASKAGAAKAAATPRIAAAR